jgi:hypothetical protein
MVAKNSPNLIHQVKEGMDILVVGVLVAREAISASADTANAKIRATRMQNAKRWGSERSPENMV